MKQLILFFTLFIVLITSSFSTTHIITNSGFTFTPSSITITVGDTVVFSLASIHDVIEVNQATWNANGTTSNGGFVLGFGGGTLVIQSAGIHYYICGTHATLGMKGIITVNPATGIIENNNSVVREFKLNQNYPNPFNPSTKINFSLSREEKISLKIFNLLGAEVTTLINAKMLPGNYTAEWNSENNPGGIYFYQLRTSTDMETRRMTLLK
ncbi:MAG: T9SS type A sorting domain-containing protein [Ignavibacteriales bacterium]|nr:T9SS type A sorting domain-containing protein [Ignavibacteriales bacterium]